MVLAWGNTLRTRRRKNSRWVSESTVPQTAVDQGEDRTRGIKRSAHIIIFRSKEKALIRDLQKTDTFNPFYEESKRVIHNLGNVDCLDLCEISSKTALPVQHLGQTESCIAPVSNTYREHEVMNKRQVRRLKGGVRPSGSNV